MAISSSHDKITFVAAQSPAYNVSVNVSANHRYVRGLHWYQTCHITFTLNAGGDDGGVITAEEAAKPLTTDRDTTTASSSSSIKKCSEFTYW